MRTMMIGSSALRTLTRTAPLALALALPTGCGSSDSSGGGSPADDIARFDQLASQVGQAAADYRATVLAADTTLGNCNKVEDAYDRTVRPWLGQMLELSHEMDGVMDDHQGQSDADMMCVAAAMMDELDAHRAVACTAADLAGERAEATRHADSMAGYAGHIEDRCNEMLRGLGGDGWTWSPIMGGCGGGPMPSDPVSVGQRVFDLGLGADGEAIPRVGGMSMGLSGSGCAACHGQDGHGLTVMMFTTPDITYANLTDPNGMIEPDGGRGMTYTDDGIRRAVIDGVDADGEDLAGVMPRWQLADKDWDGLLAYLKTLP